MSETDTANWSEAQTALRAWYATRLGQDLHQQVASAVERMLRDLYALHCLQIGGTQKGVDLLSGRGLIHRIHVTGDGADGIHAEPDGLPLATRSLDLVVLCHTLEFSHDPHAVLREVDRVLKLDGHVLAIGFNPWSLFGARRLLGDWGMPWSGRFLGPGRVTDWLALLGIRTLQRETVWLRPPIQHDVGRRYLGPCERLHRVVPWAGAVYVTLARKHSIPFTPVGRAWDRRREPAPPRGVVRPTQNTFSESSLQSSRSRIGAD